MTQAIKMPYAMESERMTLGAMLQNNDCLYEGIELLRVEDYYGKAHQIIYTAIIEIVASGGEPDVNMLTQRLIGKGKIKAVGGADYLAGLVAELQRFSNFGDHAQVILSTAKGRELAQKCEKTLDIIYSGGADYDDAVDKHAHSIYEIEHAKSQNIEHVSKILPKTMEHIDMLQRGQKKVWGIPTGFEKLDKYIGGLHEGYMIIAGRTSDGKSALATSIVRNISIYPDDSKKAAVAIFSLEMSKEAYIKRILAATAHCDANNMRDGYMTKEEQNELKLVEHRIRNSPIWIDDTAAISTLEIQAKLRKLLHRQKIDVVIIDYLQLMNPVGKYSTRAEAVSSLSRAMQEIARQYGICLIVLSQFSRQSKRERPELGWLRESGSIEQDADVVLLLHHSHKAGQDSITIGNKDYDSEGMVECIVAKQREGETGMVYLVWRKKSVCFEDWKVGDEDYEI